MESDFFVFIIYQINGRLNYSNLLKKLEFGEYFFLRNCKEVK